MCSFELKHWNTDVSCKLYRKSDACYHIYNLNKKLFTEIAFTSTTKPWSGNNQLVKNTIPTKSIVVSKTNAEITNAILISWMIDTAK